MKQSYLKKKKIGVAAGGLRTEVGGGKVKRKP